MGLDAKITFENRLKLDLEAILTVENLNRVLEIVSNTLTGFEMEVRTESEAGRDDLLPIYLNALSIQGRSPKTVSRYEYVISRFLKALSVPTREITIYHLRNYLASEKSRGVADSTLEGSRQVLSAYFNWLQREGLIQTNPSANLGAIKVKKKLKTAYSDIDIEKLKQNCGNLRDRAIVTFLLATGCRVSEMTQLNIQDVDLENLECTVLGKGNKERTVFLDTVAGMTLTQYLSQRTDHEDALFISLRGHRRIQPGGIRTMLNKLGLLAHVEHVHPHKFRRTRATNLIKHGMAVQEVAAILGHEKLDTTMEYVVMDKRAIKNAYQKYA